MFFSAITITNYALRIALFGHMYALLNGVRVKFESSTRSVHGMMTLIRILGWPRAGHRNHTTYPMYLRQAYIFACRYGVNRTATNDTIYSYTANSKQICRE